MFDNLTFEEAATLQEWFSRSLRDIRGALAESGKRMRITPYASVRNVEWRKRQQLRYVGREVEELRNDLMNRRVA
jgi:hypothetical protein